MEQGDVVSVIDTPPSSSCSSSSSSQKCNGLEPVTTASSVISIENGSICDESSSHSLLLSSSSKIKESSSSPPSSPDASAAAAACMPSSLLPRQHSELRLFLHQVTGHNILLKYDKHTLCKRLKERELRFYKHAPLALQPFVPRFKGAIDVAWIEDENNVAHIIGNRPLSFDASSSTPNLNNSKPSTASGSSLLSNHSSSQTVGSNEVQIKIIHTEADQLEIETPKYLDGRAVAAKVAFEARSEAVHPWSLEHCAVELNKLRLAIEHEGSIKFILLENLTQKFSYPCVLDLKMGTRLHGDDESDQKKERKMRRSIDSTSHELGVRLGGMEVYDITTGCYRVRDKYYGRRLSPMQLKDSVREYLHNGRRCRYELIEPFRRRLAAVLETLEGMDSFRFFSSSLLLIYDGFQPQQGADDALVASSTTTTTSSGLDSNNVVDVRMVDFAYTTWPEVAEEVAGAPRYFGPDAGYVLGLKTVCGYLDELLANCSADSNDAEPSFTCRNEDYNNNNNNNNEEK